MRSSDPAVLLGAARGGERSAVARLISLVERGGDAARAVSKLTWSDASDTYTVGLTGAPGAGKSTLTSALIKHRRAEGERIAVLAIDPSSPFTGGAILGDRVRMQEHAVDPGVFIRSMATRGHMGGLAMATPQAARVLAACGYPLVVIETVGVGQVEIEVAGAADTTVVVMNPGWGDSVQANKAGLLEAADVFVINKADRPGTAEVHRDLEAMLDMHLDPGPWRPPIVEAVAARNEGTTDVWAAVLSHRAYLESSGELLARRVRRAADEAREILVRTLGARADALLASESSAPLRAGLADGSIDPHEAAAQLLDRL